MTIPLMPRSYRGAVEAMWTIYWICEPPGAPGKFVVRRWVALEGGERATDPEPVYSGDSLHHARMSIPDEATACLHRSPEDDPTIVETWL